MKPSASSETGSRAGNGVLREQDVEGERDRRPECGQDSEPVERDAAPQVDDERQSAEREDQRRPDPSSDRLLEDEPRPERDQHGRDVLDQQGDSDLEPVDGDEVEELHEGEAGDAEEEEKRELTAPDPKAPRARRSRALATRISAAPVERTSVRRRDESPELRAAFANDPLIPQSAVAPSTIA